MVGGLRLPFKMTIADLISNYMCSLICCYFEVLNDFRVDTSDFLSLAFKSMRFQQNMCMVYFSRLLDSKVVYWK